MLVKILSMQRVINYGSFMQAYALKRVIESRGHVVRFCDFVPGEPRHQGEKVRVDRPLDKVSKVLKMLSAPHAVMARRRFRHRLQSLFRGQVWPVLGLSDELDTDTHADLVVIGSDEVFNYTQNHAFGYVPAFFGHGLQARSIVAYAASAGYANVEDIVRDGMVDEVSSGFAKFSAMGVRDQNTLEIVQRFSTQDVSLVIDPTLIYDFDAELGALPLRAESSPYLLVYAYHGRLDAPEEVSAIRRLAAERGLKVVAVGFFHDWCDENLVLPPFELLQMFQGASAVVTDTFHGSIFSIKFGRPFVSLLRVASPRGSNSNKLAFLLEQLGLSSRIVRGLDGLEAQLGARIDHAAVGMRLSALRQTSTDFLDEALARASRRAAEGRA